MKQFFIGPVIQVQEMGLTIKRLDLPDGVNYAATISADGTWGIAILATPNGLSLDNRFLDLGDVSLLDSVLSPGLRQSLTDRLARQFGIIINPDNVSTARDIIRKVGKTADKNFDEARLRVREAS